MTLIMYMRYMTNMALVMNMIMCSMAIIMIIITDII